MRGRGLENLPAPVLEELLGLARRLTARRDLDHVLQDLMEGSLKLIPGSDFACVFLYDVEENTLVPIGGVGFEMRYMQHVRLKPGESLTGRAFVQKQPLLLPTSTYVKDAQSNLSRENDHWVRLAVGRPTNPVRSSLAIPLSVGHRTVGVLVIDNYDTDRDFDEVDLRIATALADHAAIAVANAQDYQRAQALSRELQQTLSTQHKLLGSILDPAPSFDQVLRTLHTVIRRPLAIVDAAGRLVAGVGAEAPEYRKKFPIRTGGDVLGYLWVGGSALTGPERNGVEQAIPILALEFIKRAAVLREQYRLRRDMLHRVLEGDRSALHDVNQSFGLVGRRWRVAVIGGVTDAGFDARALETDAPILSGEVINGFLVVFHVQDQPVVERWAESHPGVIIVWGEDCEGLDEFSDQLIGVTHLWTMVSSAGHLFRDRIRRVSLSDFPEIGIIDGLDPDSRARFVSKVMGPILGNDEAMETLRTWIVCDRSYSRAAEFLHTHANTVRYRIMRIGEMLGRDLSQNQTIALLWMAFMMSASYPATIRQ